jgi:hypothetical protein
MSPTTSNGDTLEIGGDVTPGTYQCTLIELERFEIISTGEFDTPAGEAIPKLRWLWATEDGTTIEGSTSLATGPRSKMRAWMAAIGVDLSKPGTVKLSSLIGREALVNVSLNEQGYAAIASIVAVPAKPQRRKAPELLPLEEDAIR